MGTAAQRFEYILQIKFQHPRRNMSTVANRIANPFFWVMFSFNVNREVLQSGQHNDSNTTDKISTSIHESITGHFYFTLVSVEQMNQYLTLLHVKH